MPPSPATTPNVRCRLFAFWVGYLVFVVYGSLVPLAFKSLPLAEAWQRFLHVPMLALGVQSRADWIANGVLYAPLGFLAALWLRRDAGTGRFVTDLVAMTSCAALAIGVEFAQLYFPPRTVSLNDIVAELIGALVGIVLAARGGRGLAALLTANAGGLRHHSLEAYLALYLALSLFPYDVLLSTGELAGKIASDNWGWLSAGSEIAPFRLLLKSAIEIVLTLPIGLLLGTRRAGTAHAMLWAIVLGSAIEVAQFFTYSGIAQGLSILTRVVGVVVGLVLWRHRAALPAQRVGHVVARWSLPLALIYLAALLYASGWLTPRWNGIDAARERLAGVSFLPFYYHYYTTEMHALTSAATMLLAYLPIGVLLWARRGSARQALLAAFVVASVVEAGKLFIADLRPDPTNVLLAAFAAWSVTRLAIWATCTVSVTTVQTDGGTPKATPRPRSVAARHTAPAAPPHAARRRTRSLPAARLLLLPALALATYWACGVPDLAPAVLSVIAAGAALVYYRPALFIAVVTATLPIFDLAPWSGRFYFDEYDLLLCVCLAVAYARQPQLFGTAATTVRREARRTLFALASAALVVSFVVSTWRGLLPWTPPDANSFNNYLSAFNALRIAKGVLWALLIGALLRRQLAAASDLRMPFAGGIVVGLALTVGVVLWERVAFTGLHNFAADYRVTGPFSAMHTGGAYIECFLAIAVPFLLLLIVRPGRPLLRLSSTLLLLATTYALMVTFSRNGYLAYALAVIVFLSFALLRGAAGWRLRAFAMLLALTLVAVALPVYTGQFAQSRLATVAEDLGVRQRHWRDALEMRAPDALTTLFGMGLGSYPRSHYLMSREGGRSGSYLLGEENGRRYLRLVPGSSIYVEQLVAVEARQKYRLRLEVRSDKAGASLTVPICEKWLLSSYNCSWNGTKAGNEIGVWRPIEMTIDTRALHQAPWYSQRPVKLALYNGGGGALIDVANVSLQTIAGDELLRNGDFAQGLDHWIFSADNHLAWHTKSLPVGVLFDQGWFGIFAWSAFLLLALATAARRAWRGDLDAAAALAALVAFLVVGVFDTLIDAPRFLFIVLLLGGWCAAGASPNSARVSP